MVKGGVEVCGECGGGGGEEVGEGRSCERCRSSGVVVRCLRILEGVHEGGEEVRTFYPNVVREPTLEDFADGAGVKMETSVLE